MGLTGVDVLGTGGCEVAVVRFVDGDDTEGASGGKKPSPGIADACDRPGVL